MPVSPESPRYDLIAQAPSGQFYLRELLTSLSWEESIDEAAVRLKAEFLAEEDTAAVLRGSNGLFLTGLPFGASEPAELWRGLAWDVGSAERRAPAVSLTAYDPMIYPAQSEDDFLFEAGQTATAIIRSTASEWGIPLGTLAETAVALGRQIKRGATLWRLWFDAVKETAKKGGGLYRARMNAGRLELVALGSNATVWLLEIGVNIHEAERLWKREGTVTRAKVMGHATTETAPRPVLAVHEDPDLVGAHGVLQKILSDPDVKTASDAEALARQAVRGPEETFTLEAPDINTLRAGDAVVVRDRGGTDYTLLVERVQHDGSRGPGRMSLSLTTAQQIRWRWILP